MNMKSELSNEPMRVGVKASRAYEVLIGRGLIDQAGQRIRAVSNAKKAVIVSDDNVYPLYGALLESSLRKSGIESAAYVFPHGEDGKSLQNYASLLEFMSDMRLNRDDLLLSLGGGVAGDLGGFAASTFLRGIGFVQVPTSPLADVDSSVGGKTAVNLPSGKNRAGSFYQPMLVLCDTAALETLPEREYANGCAEIVKYGMIGDEALFDKIASRPVKENYAEVIRACVEMKKRFVEQDERDRGVRALLNFGHTVGHAVEKLSAYRVPHGRAVAIGMACVTRAAVRKGLCEESAAERLEAMLTSYGLPCETACDSASLAGACLSDKKAVDGGVNLIVPERIGACRALFVPSNEMIDWISAGRKNG